MVSPLTVWLVQLRSSPLTLSVAMQRRPGPGPAPSTRGASIRQLHRGSSSRRSPASLPSWGGDCVRLSAAEMSRAPRGTSRSSEDPCKAPTPGPPCSSAPLLLSLGWLRPGCIHGNVVGWLLPWRSLWASASPKLWVDMSMASSEALPGDHRPGGLSEIIIGSSSSTSFSQSLTFTGAALATGSSLL